MAKKNKGGRPTIFSAEVIHKLEQAFLIGATDLQACFEAGISKSALYNYQNANPEFVDRKEELKSNLAYRAKRVLAKSIDEGNQADAKWYLERKEKQEFSTQVNQEITGKDGEPFAPAQIIIKGE